ncbi:TPA: morphogenetic protein [Klebsiella pneumoniae]|uniref:morphogenetic protein n=1 Tax=Klebsiella pneumoniae complex TaxID=3390273 RepID=UPI000C18BD2F|nr:MULTISPECIES: morphogenetic protein [Klebsiella]HDH1866748.1 morphogenetic protein [Klebsiella quasipneumoniae subsp. similipneumoniae]HDS6123571.1 morphogenetic protein [Klebsiella pneumoniae subsp. pneumoniae]ATR00063.1 morphogenetic protein [Klebsiella pneumoniae]ATR05234.1 morphogenetic protein [Klebsiella pneumoniae]ATR10632.1 morphogenetic protein [Klebsiella pneumoniae]
MTERGMIFNGEMVRAILDVRKTQTRRIVKGTDGAVKFCKEWDINGEEIFVVLDEKDHTGMNPVLGAISCPFGGVGDRIWVRETWARYNIDQNSHDIAYRATTPADWPEEGRWRPSIHMPRWASRILLEITDVRVERLNVISEEDARAEGVGIAVWFAAKGVPESEWTSLGEQGAMQASHINKFATLWESIYGAESWKANSWVWVIEFKRVEGGAA